LLPSGMELTHEDLATAPQDARVSSQLPSVSTTARGPLAQELSQEHDASEVIGVVNCQTNQNFSCGRLEYSSVRLRKAGGTIQDGRITGK